MFKKFFAAFSTPDRAFAMATLLDTNGRASAQSLLQFGQMR